MALNMIPKDAQKAIDSVPEITKELKAIRKLLERLVDATEAQSK